MILDKLKKIPGPEGGGPEYAVRFGPDMVTTFQVVTWTSTLEREELRSLHRDTFIPALK